MKRNRRAETMLTHNNNFAARDFQKLSIHKNLLLRYQISQKTPVLGLFQVKKLSIHQKFVSRYQNNEKVVSQQQLFMYR